MRKATVASAKAHLSEFIAAAKRDGQRILILRRGRPAAAIVPVAVATHAVPPALEPAMSDEELNELWSRFGKATDGESALQDLVDGRARLENH